MCASIRLFPSASPFCPVLVSTDDKKMVWLRPVVFTDTAALRAFAATLSPQTVARRFNHFKPKKQRMQWRRNFDLASVDHQNDIVFVACGFPWGEILGVVEVHRDKPGATQAEIAFLVRDDAQSRGIASALTARILFAARSVGIGRVYAFTQMDNSAMIRAFLSWGFTLRHADGEVQAQLQLA